MARTPYPVCGADNPVVSSNPDCLYERGKIIALVAFDRNFDFEGFCASPEFKTQAGWQALVNNGAILGVLNKGQGQLTPTPNPITELDESERLGSMSYALDASFDGVDGRFDWYNFIATKGSGVAAAMLYEGGKKLWVFQENEGGALVPTPLMPAPQPSGNTKLDRRRMQITANFSVSDPFYPFPYDISADARPFFF